MMPSYPVPSSSQGNHSVLTDLEALLQQEEDCLVELERRVSEKRLALFGPEPRDLLDVLQAIEAIVARIGRLESTRTHLVTITASTTGVPPTAVPATSGQLLELRSRILGLIARIAEYDDATSHLVAGLARAGRARLNALSRWAGTQPSDCLPAQVLSGVEKLAASLNIQA